MLLSRSQTSPGADGPVYVPGKPGRNSLTFAPTPPPFFYYKSTSVTADSSKDTNAEPSSSSLFLTDTESTSKKTREKSKKKSFSISFPFLSRSSKSLDETKKEEAIIEGELPQPNEPEKAEPQDMQQWSPDKAERQSDISRDSLVPAVIRSSYSEDYHGFSATPVTSSQLPTEERHTEAWTETDGRTSTSRFRTESGKTLMSTTKDQAASNQEGEEVRDSRRGWDSCPLESNPANAADLDPNFLDTREVDIDALRKEDEYVVEEVVKKRESIGSAASSSTTASTSSTASPASRHSDSMYLPEEKGRSGRDSAGSASSLADDPHLQGLPQSVSIVSLPKLPDLHFDNAGCPSSEFSYSSSSITTTESQRHHTNINFDNTSASLAQPSAWTYSQQQQQHLFPAAPASVGRRSTCSRHSRSSAASHSRSGSYTSMSSSSSTASASQIQPRTSPLMACPSSSPSSGNIYSINWTRGELGLSFARREKRGDPSLCVLVVAGISPSANIESCPDIFGRVQVGDVLISVGDIEITDIELKKLLQWLASFPLPLELTFFRPHRSRHSRDESGSLMSSTASFQHVGTQGDERLSTISSRSERHLMEHTGSIVENREIQGRVVEPPILPACNFPTEAADSRAVEHLLGPSTVHASTSVVRFYHVLWADPSSTRLGLSLFQTSSKGHSITISKIHSALSGVDGSMHESNRPMHRGIELAKVGDQLVSINNIQTQSLSLATVSDLMKSVERPVILLFKTELQTNDVRETLKALL